MSSNPNVHFQFSRVKDLSTLPLSSNGTWVKNICQSHCSHSHFHFQPKFTPLQPLPTKLRKHLTPPYFHFTAPSQNSHSFNPLQTLFKYNNSSPHTLIPHITTSNHFKSAPHLKNHTPSSALHTLNPISTKSDFNYRPASNTVERISVGALKYPPISVRPLIYHLSTPKTTYNPSIHPISTHSIPNIPLLISTITPPPSIPFLFSTLLTLTTFTSLHSLFTTHSHNSH